MGNKLLVILTPEQSNLLTQVNGIRNKSREGAFHNRAKSENYNKNALKKAVPNRKNTSLVPVLGSEENLLQEPICTTVMTDGRSFALRLLAIA